MDYLGSISVLVKYQNLQKCRTSVATGGNTGAVFQQIQLCFKDAGSRRWVPRQLTSKGDRNEIRLLSPP